MDAGQSLPGGGSVHGHGPLDGPPPEVSGGAGGGAGTVKKSAQDLVSKVKSKLVEGGVIKEGETLTKSDRKGVVSKQRPLRRAVAWKKFKRLFTRNSQKVQRLTAEISSATLQVKAMNAVLKGEDSFGTDTLTPGTYSMEDAFDDASLGIEVGYLGTKFAEAAHATGANDHAVGEGTARLERAKDLGKAALGKIKSGGKAAFEKAKSGGKTAWEGVKTAWAVAKVVFHFCTLGVFAK